MDISFPSSQDVRALLAPLTMRQMERLADLSGVPMPTIYKIARATTENPGIETCRKFIPHIAAALAGHPDGRPCIDVAAPEAVKA